MVLDTGCFRGGGVKYISSFYCLVFSSFLSGDSLGRTSGMTSGPQFGGANRLAYNA